MKQFKVRAAVVVIAAALLLGWAPYHRPASQLRLSGLEKERLVLELRDYGLRRERHDRATFPVDMPKIGEPYDLVTGNAVRE